MAQGCYWFTKISGLATARASSFRFGALEFQGLRIRTLSSFSYRDPGHKRRSQHPTPLSSIRATAWSKKRASSYCKAAS